MWLVTFIACLSASDIEVAPPPDVGHRSHVTTVSFDDWDDVIALQAGADADCRFVEPQVADATTTYPPLQAFWVIHDPLLDEPVEPGFSDVYFDGDTVVPDNFPAREGQEALGFQAISAWARAMLPLDDMVVEGNWLGAELGSPVDGAIDVELVPTDAGCEAVVQACLEPCEQWVDLAEIRMELGTWGVDAVELVEE